MLNNTSKTFILTSIPVLTCMPIFSHKYGAYCKKENTSKHTEKQKKGKLIIIFNIHIL